MSAASTVVVEFVIAAVVAAVTASICKPLARRLGIVARPTADRWHRTTVPLLGGLAVVAGVLAAGIWPAPEGGALALLLAGGAAIALVGLIDDRYSLKPQPKLTAQLLVAAAVVSLAFREPLVGIYWIDLLLALIWMVAITNAFNLLDNMDGLAAGIAGIAGLTQVVLLLGQGDVAGASVAAALAGACAGFLLHNFQPASIFMGDTGSLFLGFMVAGLSLHGAAGHAAGGMAVLLFPVMVALVPLFDTALVTLNRLRAGRPISQGGRDHTSHRLVATGLTDRQAVLTLWAGAAVAGLLAIYTARFGVAESVAAVVLVALALGLTGVFLGRIRIYEEAGPQPGVLAWMAGSGGLAYWRQAGAFLSDLVLVVLAYYTAYRLRFEQTFGLEEPIFVESLPVVIAAKMAAFALLRTYQGLWRYTSLRDLVRLAQAVSLGTVLAVLAILALHRFQGYSRALFAVDWLLLLLFTGGSRVLVRLLAERLRPRPSTRRPVLIYGAGDGGVMVLREIRNNAALGREAVGFLDDDVTKARTDIQGVRVLGTQEALERLLQSLQVAEVIVSSSTIPADRVDALRACCQRYGVVVVRSVLRLE